MIMKALVEEGRSLAQGSQYRTGGCIDLASGMIYFGTSQYWYTVSGLPLFYIFNIHTHTHKISIYHKTLPQKSLLQLRTNCS